MEKETAKTIVKVISILYFIFAAISLVFAILGFVGGRFLAEIFGPFGSFFAGIGLVVGVVSLIFAIIYLIVGIGLWKFNNVARIVAIIFSILGIIGSLISIYTIISIIFLIIHGAIFYFLTFQKEVVALFK